MIILNVTTFTTARFFFFRIEAKAEKELRKKFKVDFFSHSTNRLFTKMELR